MTAIYLLLKLVYYGLPTMDSTAQKDGFVQMCIAKIQPQPANMLIVMRCIVSSGEADFGIDQPKIHFIGE